MAAKAKQQRRRSAKPPVKITLRLPAELYDKLKELKERDGIALQGAGVVALREYVEKRKRGT